MYCQGKCELGLALRKANGIYQANLSTDNLVTLEKQGKEGCWHVLEEGNSCGCYMAIVFWL